MNELAKALDTISKMELSPIARKEVAPIQNAFAAGRDSVLRLLREPSEGMVEARAKELCITVYDGTWDEISDHGKDCMRVLARQLLFAAADAIEAEGKLK